MMKNYNQKVSLNNPDIETISEEDHEESTQGRLTAIDVDK